MSESNFSLYWCKLDKTALKSWHLNKITTWSRLTNSGEITPESHTQKLGQSGTHQHWGRKKPGREAFPADTFWDATKSGARPLHKCLWGFHFSAEKYCKDSSNSLSFAYASLGNVLVEYINWMFISSHQIYPLWHKLHALPSIFPQNSSHKCNSKSSCMNCIKVSWQVTITLDSDKKELYLWTIRHKCYIVNFEDQGMRGGRGRERPHTEDSWQRCRVRTFGFSNVRRVGRPLEANTGWLKNPLGSPRFRCVLPGGFHTNFAHSRTQSSYGSGITNHLHVGKKTWAMNK